MFIVTRRRKRLASCNNNQTDSTWHSRIIKRTKCQRSSSSRSLCDLYAR